MHVLRLQLARLLLAARRQGLQAWIGSADACEHSMLQQVSQCRFTQALQAGQQDVACTRGRMSACTYRFGDLLRERWPPIPAPGFQRLC